MIDHVQFHRFKQFSDQTFSLHPGISLLGGGNNAGKTTILHGLAIWEFCRTALEMERGTSTFEANWNGQGVGLGDDEFSPINVPSLKHLWTNLRTQKEKEPDGYTLKLRCEWSTHHLEFGLSLANDRLFVKPTSSSLGPTDSIPRMAYLPPFAGMTDRETRTTGAIRRRRIGEGLAGAVLRSILLDMFESNAGERTRLRAGKNKISDADLASLRMTDPWESLQQNLRTTFGLELDVSPFSDAYHSYVKVDVVKGTLEGFKLKRHPKFNPRDLMVEGSGFLQWLSVLAVAYDPEFDVLLLDEPDAHLHSSLQEQLLTSLKEVATITNKQMLIATHSTEILRNADPADIFQIRGGKGGRYLTDEKQKVGLLAGLGSDYAPRVDRAKRTKRVLFVEGTSDVTLLKTLAGRLNLPWPASWVEWQTTHSHSERKKIFNALREEIPELVAISLRDRDDEPIATVKEDLVDGADQGGFYPRRWRRRHIESYLIWPAAIAAATNRTAEDIESDLSQHHAIAVNQAFVDWDPPSALLDVRGKEILKDMKAKPVDVASQMDAAAIPADIRTFLADLSSAP